MRNAFEGNHLSLVGTRLYPPNIDHPLIAVSGAISTIFQWRFLGGNHNNGLILIPNIGRLSIGHSLAGGLRDKIQ